MKSVSSDFLIAQNLKNTFPITRVYYKRRYWNGSNAYIWEASWTELDRNKFENLSNIVHQLDTETLTEFRVSNLDLSLLNDDNAWDENNASGYFGADGGSAYGYEPYLMKFQIKTGFTNIGEKDIRQGTVVRGTEELLTVFTGIAVDWQLDSESRKCSVTIEGLERLMLDSDAEELSDLVSLETIGTGDGKTKDFYTANAGVRKVTEVTVNAVTMIKGTDYNISRLGDIDEGVEVSLSQPPAYGVLIKCSYSHWKKNQTIENLIDDLVDLTPITSKSISNATLGSIQNNFTLSSKAEFDLGTNTSLNTFSENGSIKIDYSASGNLLTIDNFNSGTLAGNGWSGGGSTFLWDIVSNEAVFNAGASGSAIYGDTGISHSISSSAGIGEWGFKVKADVGINEISILLGDYILTLNPLFTRLSIATDYTDYNAAGFSTSYKTYKIRRSISGVVEVFLDGVLIISTVDYSARSMASISIVVAYTGGASKAYFDDVYAPASTLGGTHLSKAMDTIGGLTAWGKLSVLQNSSVGILSYKTQTSTDNSTYDALVAVSGTNGINSAVKRYIKVEITFAYASTSPPVTDENGDGIEPEVFSYTVQFTSDRVFIALADFSGMNCYDAITDLAKLSDFEFGMDDSETFFFRARNTSTSVDMVFNQSTNLSKIVYCKVDYGILYNGVRASFGSFTSEKNSVVDTETSAREILATSKIYDVNSDILINKDTDVAEGIATKFLTRLEKKRIRIRLISKFLPQIELSDTVEITYKHTPTDTVPFLNALKCNVLSTMHDCSNYMSEFEVEEIT